MASKEQVGLVLERLRESPPSGLFRIIDESCVGVEAVLRYLSESSGDVTAGSISDFMRVSTARVAVLIRKMASQGLITKECAANDARVTIVRLTPLGWERIRQRQAELFADISSVIDKVGMDRLLEFISISKEIQDALLRKEI